MTTPTSTTPPPRKPTVAEAKQELAAALQSLDLLEPLRKHPVVVVGAAATAGVVLGSSGKVILGLGALTGGLLRLVKPLSGIVAQVLAAKVAAKTAVDETKEPDPPAAVATPAAGVSESAPLP